GTADRCDLSGYRAPHFGERGRGRVLAYEDVRTPDFGAELRQADVRPVPSGDPFELGRAVQCAIQGITPAVIGAANHVSGAATATQLRPPMPTYVRHRAHDAVGRTGDQHRLARDLAREPASRLCKPLGVPNGLPRAGEDPVALGGENRGIRIPTRR